MGSEARIDDTAALPTKEKASSFQLNIVGENRKLRSIERLGDEQAEADDQKAAAWTSIGSVRHGTATTKKVHFYANRTSVLKSEDGVHKKLDAVSLGKRRVKGENIERVDEVAFAAMQEMHVLDKGTGRETSKIVSSSDNEALKKKLLEAVGTAPLQKKQTTGLLNHEKTKNLNTKQNSGCQRGEVARHKQNSGPIGTDLESLDQTKSRPVNHSLIQKKGPTKTLTKLQHQIANAKKPLPSSVSDYKLKFQEKNMFAFDQGEGKEGSIEWDVSGCSSRFNSKRSGRVTVEPRRLYFPRHVVSDMSLPANVREQIVSSAKKAPSHRKEKGDFPGQPSRDKKGFSQTSNEVSKESSDDTREINESQDVESPPVMEEKEAEEKFPQSPMEEHDTKSFENDLLSQGADCSKKSSSTLRHSKRVHIQEDAKPSKINLFPSPTGTSRTEETMGSHEASEPHLAGRTFSQMASVLDGFNTKLRSHTSKKSSEILSSALDKIRRQLQVVESQIQADVGKLTNVGKSKRKRLESTFQEQHERLRLLHDKFKEEVDQQLLDCRSTLEELEAYQMELKGTTERQKASHKKLLMQTEEAMKAQLSDAHTCFAAVHKEARKRMNGVKHVLEEWMTEEIF